MNGRTATASGGSVRSGPGGKSGELGWKVGLGGTEMRCWICCEDEPCGVGPERGQAGGGSGGSGPPELGEALGPGRAMAGGGGGGGTSLRSSSELVEPELEEEERALVTLAALLLGWWLVWAPYGGGWGLGMGGAGLLPS